MGASRGDCGTERLPTAQLLLEAAHLARKRPSKHSGPERKEPGRLIRDPVPVVNLSVPQRC